MGVSRTLYYSYCHRVIGIVYQSNSNTGPGSVTVTGTIHRVDIVALYISIEPSSTDSLFEIIVR